jgi:hypothetical protein
MFMVVPVEEGTAEVSALRDGEKAIRKVRPIIERLEVCLRIRTVGRGVGAGMLDVKRNGAREGDPRHGNGVSFIAMQMTVQHLPGKHARQFRIVPLVDDSSQGASIPRGTSTTRSNSARTTPSDAAFNSVSRRRISRLAALRSLASFTPSPSATRSQLRQRVFCGTARSSRTQSRTTFGVTRFGMAACHRRAKSLRLRPTRAARSSSDRTGLRLRQAAAIALATDGGTLFVRSAFRATRRAECLSNETVDVIPHLQGDN